MHGVEPDGRVLRSLASASSPASLRTPPGIRLEMAMSKRQETMATEPADVTIPRLLAKRGQSRSWRNPENDAGSVAYHIAHATPCSVLLGSSSWSEGSS